MAKFFKIMGIVFFLACTGLFIAVLASSGADLWGLLSVFSVGIFGLMLIAIGDLMDRVDKLEDKLKIEKDSQDNAPEIMQVTCPNCGKKCDMDYPKCPNCGYSLKR